MGSWSMIYDESFIIQVPGFEFFASFMYLAGKKVTNFPLDLYIQNHRKKIHEASVV